MTVISESQLSPEVASQTHKDVYVEAKLKWNIPRDLTKVSLMWEWDEGSTGTGTPMSPSQRLLC